MEHEVSLASRHLIHLLIGLFILIILAKHLGIKTKIFAKVKKPKYVLIKTPCWWEKIINTLVIAINYLIVVFYRLILVGLQMSYKFPSKILRGKKKKK